MKKGIALVGMIALVGLALYSVIYKPISEAYAAKGLSGGLTALFAVLITFLVVSLGILFVNWAFKQLKW